ncbi:MAG: hypothetical protein M0Q38_07255 [Bacteroidales bacterium]|jgi:uncharacterized membrane protein|nr:hypothetical protein [Bacteroidales bacterium]
MKKTFFGLMVCATLMGACSKSSNSFVPDCSGSTKSFSNDVLPVFQSACVSCHSQYSGYSQISAAKTTIRSKIVDGSMPPGNSLSTAQKNNIVCWIDNGAPNN